jgi:hypothetical protein
MENNGKNHASTLLAHSRARKRFQNESKTKECTNRLSGMPVFQKKNKFFHYKLFLLSIYGNNASIGFVHGNSNLF